MKRSPGRTQLPRTRRSRPGPFGVADSVSIGRALCPLDALSAASDQYAHGASASRPRPRRPSWTLSVLAALVIGTALVFAGRFEYRCGATLRFTGQPGRETTQSCRRDLLDYAWLQLAGSENHKAEQIRWAVDSPGHGLLRLIFTTPEKRAGVEKVRSIVEGYIEAAQAKTALRLITPTQSENLLSGLSAELHERLDGAQAQIQAALAALPEADPKQNRAALLARWQTQRSDFATLRTELSEASDSLARLEAEPEPTYGIVPSSERSRALEADAALQQDLRELTVELTELKLHLLNVWQQSAGALEQLAIAVEELFDIVASQRTAATGGNGKARGEPVLADSWPYAEALEEFAVAWNKEFTALQRLTVDPLSSEGVDVHARARLRLHDFLFSAAKHLAAMRSQVSSRGGGAADRARYHVLESNLTRGFRTVQAAHHQFEFAAGAIEPRDNFRLDAALQGARGLRRRTQKRIQAIDQRLATQAAQRARKQRLGALAQTKRATQDLRESADTVVAALVALQEELNASAGAAEEFLRAVLRAEAASALVDVTREDLDRTQSLLRDLAKRRVTAEDSHAIEIVSYGVIGRPVNLTNRLRFGGIGAGLALAAVFAGQWWIARRP